MIAKDKIETGLVLLLVVVCIGALIYVPKPKGKVYTCSLAEISPDYPLEVKEECRKLNSVKIK
jgi:hypothetical protein